MKSIRGHSGTTPPVARKCTASLANTPGPFGNHTWLAGKSPMNGGFDRKIIDFYGPFSIAMFDYRRVYQEKGLDNFTYCKPLGTLGPFKQIPSGKRLHRALENNHLLIGKSTVKVGHFRYVSRLVPTDSKIFQVMFQRRHTHALIIFLRQKSRSKFSSPKAVGKNAGSKPFWHRKPSQGFSPLPSSNLSSQQKRRYHFRYQGTAASP